MKFFKVDVVQDRNGIHTGTVLYPRPFAYQGGLSISSAVQPPGFDRNFAACSSRTNETDEKRESERKNKEGCK